jgi:hypothetical protein
MQSAEKNVTQDAYHDIVPVGISWINTFATPVANGKKRTARQAAGHTRDKPVRGRSIARRTGLGWISCLPRLKEVIL